MSTDSCGWAVSALSADMDGELNEVDSTRLRQHLEGCSSCRARQQEMEQISIGLQEEGRSVPPVPAWERLQSKLDRKYRIPQARVLLAAAAIIVVLLLVAWKFDRIDRNVRTAGFEFDLPAGLLAGLLAPDGPPEKLEAGGIRLIRTGDISDLNQAVGFVPMAPESLPGGFERETCCLFDTSGCRLVGIRYRKGNDIIVVLQHQAEEDPPCNGSESPCSFLRMAGCTGGRCGEFNVVQAGRADVILTMAGRLDGSRMEELIGSM